MTNDLSVEERMELEYQRRLYAKLRKVLLGEIKDIHKFNPQYVFLTECSAIPDGYAIKEAWKKAYSEEKIPIFYRIDPQHLQYVRNKGSPTEKMAVASFFKKRIKDPNARILVYDERPYSGGSLKAVVSALTVPMDPKQPEYKNVKGTFRRFDEVSIGNILQFLGRSEIPIHLDTRQNYSLEGSTYERQRDPLLYLGGKITKKKSSSGAVGLGEEDIPMGRKNFGGLDGGLRGRIKRREDYIREDGPQKCEGNPGRDLIKGFKKIGREIGEELRAELQVKKDLEQKVFATASVIGIISGIFFLSNFSKSFQLSPEIFSSNSVNFNFWLGIILILIGIFAGIFWYKKRK